MPNLNGTGPMGKGSMTGKAMGYCIENSSEKFSGFSANSNFGFGCGRGRRLFNRSSRQFGLKKGFRWKQVEITSEEEKSFLENELKTLESETENIKKRLGEISK